MLTPFDDLPLHQSPEPIAFAGSSDRNAYERYFFNGYDRDGDLFFAAALGVYPNRQVIDASFSVLRFGVQRSVHASARLGEDRVRTSVGPLSIEVRQPLRTLDLRVAAPDLGVSADLTFAARTPAVEEPRFRLHDGARVVFDYTRLTQWGAWSGSIDLDGDQMTIVPERHLGSRDRSWGIRPVGEPPGGAPAHRLPQFFWLWAPLNFDDCCVHFDVNELGDGRRWHEVGMVVPLLDRRDGESESGDRIEEMRTVSYEIDWERGTRRSERARMDLHRWDGSTEHVELDPMLTFPMKGLGYLSPHWGHGTWKGELQVGTEEWKVDDLDPQEPSNIHVQQLVRARWGDREGIGVFEQLAVNAHTPTGLAGFFDGAR
jgi:hypothetical protein